MVSRLFGWIFVSFLICQELVLRHLRWSRRNLEVRSLFLFDAFVERVSFAAKVTTARGYKRPDRLPDGYLIEDGLNKRSWRVGPLLGQGGFADVYLGESLRPTTSQGAGYRGPFLRPHSFPVSDHVTKPVTSATAKNVLKFVSNCFHGKNNMDVPLLVGASRQRTTLPGNPFF